MFNGFYSLEELSHPHMVFAVGFFITTPASCL